MTRVIDDLVPGAVSGYARRLHTVIGDRHHIASPLGAWLVLALIGAAAQGAEAERLGDVLGMPAADAAQAARRLLDDPHPQVAAAAAVWAAVIPDAAAGWMAELPASVERGPIPSRAAADAWARDHTFGLIEKFPLDLDVPPMALVASALAARINWTRPFDLAPSDAFRSPWRDRVTTVLRTPGDGHQCSIVTHPETGDVAVHRASADGMTVTSVIAAQDVPPARVFAAAHDIACQVVDRVQQRSLSDLPLGDGPAWTVTESAGVPRDETFSAFLPAWSASDRHDLKRPDTGLADAATTLMRLFGADQWEAAQAVTARYHRRGFEAAAVTALGVALSFGRHATGRPRDAVLRFDHPFAVVATTKTRRTSPWLGLPVFSAWITEPEDAAER